MMTETCTHPMPIGYGASQVSWNAAGTVGHVVEHCEACGEYVRWEVREP